MGADSFASVSNSPNIGTVAPSSRSQRSALWSVSHSIISPWNMNVVLPHEVIVMIELTNFATRRSSTIHELVASIYTNE